MAKIANILVLVGFTAPLTEDGTYQIFMSHGVNVVTVNQSLADGLKDAKALLLDVTKDFPVGQLIIDKIREFEEIKDADYCFYKTWWRLEALPAWVADDVEFDEEYLVMVNNIQNHNPVDDIDYDKIPENIVHIEFDVNVKVKQTIDLTRPEMTKEQLVEGLKSGQYKTTLSHGEDLPIPGVVDSYDGDKCFGLIVQQTTDINTTSADVNFEG